MIEELKILIRMQKYDDIIGKKELLTKSLPKELNSLKQNLKDAEEQLSEIEHQLSENQTSQKLKELEIKTNNEKIEKYKNQLLSIKTNREYKALNSEVRHLETLNSGIDDELIALMEIEANLKTALEENKKLEKIANDELKANEEKLKNKITEVEKNITEIRNKRNTLATDLPQHLVKRYAALIKNKGRKAVVYNENNACSGCGYSIRPQLIIEIHEGKKIVSCEGCGRMLVPEPAIK
ncbi:MAG: hypothetical protein K8R49_02405 [Candidatus Cloacimonetes bacterium]|nr:hypothetical protein [Candidatus Cloacimonadota bacterium]